MRTILAICLGFFCLEGTSQQSVEAIKTDEDCLRFIKATFGKQDMKDFHFEPAFTPDEWDKLGLKNVKQSNWGKADFDGDGKSDLYFFGQYGVSFGNTNYGYLYLTRNNPGKDVWSLIRFSDRYYRPVIFHQKGGAKPLLFVYLFSSVETITSDSIAIHKKGMYPKGINAIDTLVYKYDRLINYACRPSRLSFDSIYCSITLSFAFNRNDISEFGLLVNKDGSGLLGRMGSRNRKIRLKTEELSLLKNLISEIDLANTDTSYLASGTDHASAKLKIYHQEKMVSVYDYGMASNFTLMAIYDLFREVANREAKIISIDE